MRNSPGSLLRATPPAAKGKRPSPCRSTVHEHVDRSRVGPFTCNGDPASAPTSRTVHGAAGAGLAGPDDDVRNSPTNGVPGARLPSSVNTLGYGSGVFDRLAGFRSNDNQSAVRLVSHRDAAWAGVLFVAADIRP